MRLPLVSGRFVRLVALVAFLPALLVSPMKGDAQAPETGDLMEKMDADFVALVQAALIASVQEPVNETPYGTIEKHAESIAATAKILPSTEEFRGDNSMLVFSRQLEGAATGLAKAAKTQKIDETAKALFEVHGVCVRCHEEARF